jgi:hypothetical protein
MYNNSKKGYNDIMLNVKGIKRGRMYETPDPIDENEVSLEDKELLNSLMDPHSWGPGYGEE